MRQRERAYLFDIWRDVGFRPFDLRVVLRGNFSDRLLRYSRFENAYYISPSELKEQNIATIISFLRRLPRFFLHCYPSSLRLLLDLVGEKQFRTFRIAGVLAGSEAFPREQMQWFARRFGIGIAHWYGHSEYAVLAKFCTDCHGFQFYPTYGMAEFLPTQERRVFKIIAS